MNSQSLNLLSVQSNLSRFIDTQSAFMKFLLMWDSFIILLRNRVVGATNENIFNFAV